MCLVLVPIQKIGDNIMINYSQEFKEIKKEREIRKSCRMINEDKIKEAAVKIKSTFDIDIEQIKSKSRKREIVMARFSLMWIGYYSLDHSYELLGKFFNRNHASVINACRTLEDWYDTEPLFREKFKGLVFESKK